MQRFRLLNKKKALPNTPLSSKITIFSVSIAAASGLFSVWFYLYKAESFYQALLKETSEWTSYLEKRKANNTNKDFQRYAYKDYLNQKKVYQAQLEAESQQRLEKLKAVYKQDNTDKDKSPSKK